MKIIVVIYNYIHVCIRGLQMAQHLIVEKVEITKDNDNIENKYLYKISLKPIYIV